MDSRTLIRVLLEKAQGKRTSQQFAEAVGIDETTLRRFKAGFLIPSPDILKQIAQNAESPKLDILDELSKAFKHLEKERDVEDLFNEKRKRDESNQKMVVIMALLQASFCIFDAREEIGNKHKYPIDLVIETNALENERQCWAFSFIGCSHNLQDEYSGSISPYRLVSIVEDVASQYYLKGPRYARATIVTTDANAFYNAKFYLSKYIIDDEISILLIDHKEKVVIEEYVIPLKDGRTPKLPFKNQNS